MTEIKSLTIEELRAALADMGEKPFRAGQIFGWLHRGVESFEEMTNLSKDLRQRLAERFVLTVPTVARKQVSQVDGTIKYLWRLRDGDCVESVLMHYEHGVSVCVSHPGRVPHGVQILRLGPWRPQAPPVRGRDFGRNPVYAEGQRRDGFQYRTYGHR